MIVFILNDFTPHKEKFSITKPHENTWSFYLKQYEVVLSLLNRKASQLRYEINSKSYPYLFLLRHYCELKLKAIIASRNDGVAPHTHEFPDLLNRLPDAPNNITEAIELIDLDTDGSCYRYFYDKENNLNQLYGTKKECLRFYELISALPNESEFKLNLGISPPFTSQLNYEFTFHFNEIDQSALFRSQYDELTRFLINSVISEEGDINDIYLPLLFSIRHSIELALKEALSGIMHMEDEEKSNKTRRLINNEHKLTQLFKKYALLIAACDVSILPSEVSEDFRKHKEKTDQLKEYLHLLDSNSRYFRYPFDPEKQHLNISSNIVIDVISSFLEIDAFITFNIDMLKSYNVIPYTSKEMEDLMGFSPY